MHGRINKIVSAEFAKYCGGCDQAILTVIFEVWDRGQKTGELFSTQIHDDGSLDNYWKEAKK